MLIECVSDVETTCVLVDSVNVGSVYTMLL